MTVKKLIARFGAAGFAVWIGISIVQFAVYAPLFKVIFAEYAKLLGVG